MARVSPAPWQKILEQRQGPAGHSTGVAARGADPMLPISPISPVSPISPSLRVVPAAPVGWNGAGASGKQSTEETDGTDDDAALVRALRAGRQGATAALVDRHGAHLRRVLFRVLGAHDGECQEALQEVVTRAWEGIDGLEDPRALKAWLTRIAVFTARDLIRRRRRRRWLVFFEDVPEQQAVWAGPALEEAARCVYRIFERMPTDERIAFALRMLEGLDLHATAEACGMSVATVRRRLARAERRFFKMARQYEALEPWLATGARERARGRAQASPSEGAGANAEPRAERQP